MITPWTDSIATMVSEGQACQRFQMALTQNGTVSNLRMHSYVFYAVFLGLYFCTKIFEQFGLLKQKKYQGYHRTTM